MKPGIILIGRSGDIIIGIPTGTIEIDKFIYIIRFQRKNILIRQGKKVLILRTAIEFGSHTQGEVTSTERIITGRSSRDMVIYPIEIGTCTYLASGERKAV